MGLHRNSHFVRLLSVNVTSVQIFSMVQSFFPEYELLWELHALTQVGHSYALLVCMTMYVQTLAPADLQNDRYDNKWDIHGTYEQLLFLLLFFLRRCTMASWRWCDVLWLLLVLSSACRAQEGEMQTQAFCSWILSRSRFDSSPKLQDRI